jgi:hypothetical protein
MSDFKEILERKLKLAGKDLSEVDRMLELTRKQLAAAKRRLEREENRESERDHDDPAGA